MLVQTINALNNSKVPVGTLYIINLLALAWVRKISSDEMLAGDLARLCNRGDRDIQYIRLNSFKGNEGWVVDNLKEKGMFSLAPNLGVGTLVKLLDVPNGEVLRYVREEFAHDKIPVNMGVSNILFSPYQVIRLIIRSAVSESAVIAMLTKFSQITALNTEDVRADYLLTFKSKVSTNVSMTPEAARKLLFSEDVQSISMRSPANSQK